MIFCVARLSLNAARAATPPGPGSGPGDPESEFDLTDRDAVRQLMVNKKAVAAELDCVLGDAMADWGTAGDKGETLIIGIY